MTTTLAPSPALLHPLPTPALVVRWPCGCVRCVWPLPIRHLEALAAAEREWARDGCAWVDEAAPLVGRGGECGHRAFLEAGTCATCGTWSPLGKSCAGCREEETKSK